MKLSELFKQKKATLSFEVFPPKSWDAYNNVKTATEEIARLSPDFMSVTYGAGGGASATSASIAENILKNFGVTPLAHLTCVSSTKQAVREYLAELSKNGIENILALRGDIPNEGLTVQEYRYASELILDIKAAGNFCIGGACYPEGHTESKNQKEDIRFLKEKVDMGCDFLTTQMFLTTISYIISCIKFVKQASTCRWWRALCRLQTASRFSAL